LSDLTPKQDASPSVRVLGCPVPKWCRWPVVAAFMFFLVKGLMWLTVPALLVWSRGCGGE
jgi:hypothetical protein